MGNFDGLKVKTFCVYMRLRALIESNMTNPEILVKSFIEDYFSWNKRAHERFEKIQASETLELLAIGITEPFRLDQIKNVSQYTEIKGRYSNERAELFSKIDAEYKKIIEKYCRPNYKHLNVAFGSESSHDPNHENLVSVKTEYNKSIIKTKRAILLGNIKHTDDFEFHFRYENDRWYLEQIYYVNDEGEYESL